MSNPLKGISYFLSGIALVLKPAIRKYAFWPIIINTITFILLIVLAFTNIADLINWMLSFLPEWLDFIRYIFWPLLAIASMIILVLIFSIIANLIASPFNAALAAAIEKQLGITNRTYENTLKSNSAQIMNEIRKIIYYILRAIPLLILFIIPVINIVAPFAWLIFSAWILSIEYTDYPMGNHNITFTEQRKRLKQRKILSLSFGSTVTFAMMIPLLNFIVMPVAVAGATKMWVEDLSGDELSAD